MFPLRFRKNTTELNLCRVRVFGLHPISWKCESYSVVFSFHGSANSTMRKILLSLFDSTRVGAKLWYVEDWNLNNDNNFRSSFMKKKCHLEPWIFVFLFFALTQVNAKSWLTVFFSFLHFYIICVRVLHLRFGPLGHWNKYFMKYREGFRKIQQIDKFKMFLFNFFYNSLYYFVLCIRQILWKHFLSNLFHYVYKSSINGSYYR